MATNWYIHTPICSPSRSELLTGRYFHNLKRTGGPGYCAGMHVNYSKVHPNTFGRILKEQGGYATGMFGKYVNEMPSTVPPGWDAWLANGGGDYIAPLFQTKGISGLPDGAVKFSSDPSNYTTAVVGNRSIAWIKEVARTGRPFLAYIAPKAAHEPFNPAPWYQHHWDPSWPDHEPITENWNASFESRKGHHGNIATEPLITKEASSVITGIFKNRWRTLMSVDDVIADVIDTVSVLGLSEHTYFFFSSDHGFQLGQFNIPMDKRHVYEWDTKIHLLARGPGISAGSTFHELGTQVDIAPTLLGLAGLSSELHDGKSIAPFLLQNDGGNLLESTRLHLDSLPDVASYRSTWRKELFFEAYYCSHNFKCILGPTQQSGNYPHADSLCADLEKNELCWAEKTGNESMCYMTEDLTNNFIALRQIDGTRNNLYAEFHTGNQAVQNIDFQRVDFVEYYDLSRDPWQQHNLADKIPSEAHAWFSKRLRNWYECSGPTCDPAAWGAEFIVNI
eukprot:TRINITY_DN12775_c0_g1_i2.p1 TRINITY_DN12775_c0_g1~~TRINITY_DN12775_c0_g1_i2.p1  ORF type:complete len:587 (-),score=86.87 TRINITY_DN12775_c0_g1_i2:20-1537(-)